uniref:Chlororespiratory reduction31 n=1 Tax=Erodium gruinum TaxID=337380 RepID=A0A0F7CYV2_9ROSI
MASSSITLQTLQGPRLKSHFLGRKPQNPIFSLPKQRYPKASAKFNLFEVLGGRGLCNGEKGIEEELNKTIKPQQTPPPPSPETEQSSGAGEVPNVPEDGFGKEMMGLTGGFPGGETGLMKFVEKNPPEKLVELVPGMIAIVMNPESPFYMYCGVVQRIGDGKGVVLFDGGNWDRLVTFGLEELEPRERGPPAKKPESAVLKVIAAEKDLQ